MLSPPTRIFLLPCMSDSLKISHIFETNVHGRVVIKIYPTAFHLILLETTIVTNQPSNPLNIWQQTNVREIGLEMEPINL